MLARLVDGSEHIEYRPDYGPEVYCGLAKIDGYLAGIIANRQGFLGKDYPKIYDVYSAYERAGYELATLGYIRHSTQRKANQEIVPLPFFRVLKHLRPIKERVIEYLTNETENKN